jgi:hypothetical protein
MAERLRRRLARAKGDGSPIGGQRDAPVESGVANPDGRFGFAEPVGQSREVARRELELAGAVAEVGGVEAHQARQSHLSALGLEHGLAVEVGAGRELELAAERLGLVVADRRARARAAVEREVNGGSIRDGVAASLGSPARSGRRSLSGARLFTRRIPFSIRLSG